MGIIGIFSQPISQHYGPVIVEAFVAIGSGQGEQGLLVPGVQVQAPPQGSDGARLLLVLRLGSAEILPGLKRRPLAQRSE